MWSAQFDIIVETLTGSEFEVTVTDKDTIGFIKSQIQTHEGIPVAQQNLIFKDRELSDDLEMRDIPLVKGSRLKFVLGMKGGPVSARRVVSMPDYDNWLDLNDILNSSRQDPLTMATPSVRMMVYKNYKKNIHRAMKCRADRKKQQFADSQKDDDGLGDLDHQDDPWLKVNQHTLQKMMQIRSKLVSKKKKRNPLFRRQTSDERSCGEPSETKATTTDIGAVGDRPNQKRDVNIDENNVQFMTDFSGFEDYEFTVRHTRNCCKSCNRPAKHIYTDVQENRNLLNKHGLTKTCMRQQSLPQINQNCSTGAANMINCPSSASSGLKPIDFHDYFNVNSDSDLANNINHYTENRLKLRDNIRRNRSFKTISNHDLLVEEQLPPYYSRHLLGRPQTTSASSSSAIDRFLANRNTDERSQSASFHDLIEQFSSKNKHRTAHSNESLTECGGDGSSTSYHQTQPYFENTSPTLHAACEPIARRTSTSAANFHNFGFSLGPDKPANTFADYAMGRDAARQGTDNSTFCLYNSVSEPKHQYELPKLLIREDSPVETIHSSDPQLETVTMCGGGGGGKGVAEQTSNSTIDKLPEIDNHHHHIQHRHSTQGRQLHNDLFTSFTPANDEQTLRNPWSHHHSDLGLNHIDLNCLSTNDLSSSSEHMGATGPENHKKLFPTNATHTLKSWKQQGIVPHSTGSINAKSSGELSSTVGVGNNDAFMGSGPKAKHSVDLKEFRMKFGSSPTLMSFPRNSTNNQQAQQTPSRLDAVPFHYRRGYTNLNDVCLSSSTSDLEGFSETDCTRGPSSNNVNQQQHQEQPQYNGDHHSLLRNEGSAESERLSAGNPDAMLRNRKHHRLDYVRSYENLDSSNSLVGLMDEQGAENGGVEASGYSNESCYTHFERNRTSNDDDFLDSQGRYDFSTDSFSTTAASGFQSNESLFNVNFDSFEDTILDIEKLTLFEPLSPCTALSPPSPALHQEPNSSQSFSTTNQFNDSRLLLYETMLESIDAELRQCRHTLPSNDVLSKLTIDVAGIEPLTVDDSAAFPLQPPKKPDKLRCAECNKRLGVIMVMRCHCDKVFCTQHRYAEAHNCSYDFKLHGKLELERDNPLVVATKLPKI